MKAAALLCALALAVPSAGRGGETAALTAAVPFSGHMVLQRGAPVPVWGTAAAGDAVTVEFAGQKLETAAGTDGVWRVTLAALAASTEPRTLAIRSGRGGALAFEDVLVGEVWICSGQSNMEMPVGNLYRPEVYPGVRDFAREAAAATNGLIRFFRVDHQAADHPMRTAPATGWEVCSPRTAARFSAAGYFFARDLQEHLQVPVGMISSAWGATSAVAWCAPSGLGEVPAFARRLARSEALRARDRAAGHPREPDRSDPASLYDGMIAPLVPYAIRGVIWYQGEADARAAGTYHDLFAALIRSWRRSWGAGDFPFLFVQLAAYRGRAREPVESGSWAELREAQARTLAVTNTGMAVAIDIGDARRIHPANKQEVGRRLALLARSLVYGEAVAATGPVYRSFHAEGGKLRLSFGPAGCGPKARGGGAITGFAVAGADGVWHRASAEAAGDDVLVGCPEVPAPVAARYAWANNPDCDLVGADGLPAAPFRTDAPAAR